MLELLGAAGSRFLSDLVEYLNQKQRNIYKNKNSKKKKFECSNCSGLQVAASSLIWWNILIKNKEIFTKTKIPKRKSLNVRIAWGCRQPLPLASGCSHRRTRLHWPTVGYSINSKLLGKRLNDSTNINQKSSREESWCPKMRTDTKDIFNWMPTTPDIL